MELAKHIWPYEHGRLRPHPTEHPLVDEEIDEDVPIPEASMYKAKRGRAS